MNRSAAREETFKFIYSLEVQKEELILFSSVTKVGKQESYSKILENI